MKLNFSSTVSEELSTGSKELNDGEMCGGEILLSLIYYVKVLHVRDTTRRLTVRMISLVCSVDVEMITVSSPHFPPC